MGFSKKDGYKDTTKYENISLDSQRTEGKLPITGELYARYQALEFYDSTYNTPIVDDAFADSIGGTAYTIYIGVYSGSNTLIRNYKIDRTNNGDYLANPLVLYPTKESGINILKDFAEVMKGNYIVRIGIRSHANLDYNNDLHNKTITYGSQYVSVEISYYYPEDHYCNTPTISLDKSTSLSASDTATLTVEGGYQNGHVYDMDGYSIQRRYSIDGVSWRDDWSDGWYNALESGVTITDTTVGIEERNEDGDRVTVSYASKKVVITGVTPPENIGGFYQFRAKTVSPVLREAESQQFIDANGVETTESIRGGSFDSGYTESVSLKRIVNLTAPSDVTLNRQQGSSFTISWIPSQTSTEIDSFTENIKYYVVNNYRKTVVIQEAEGYVLWPEGDWDDPWFYNSYEDYLSGNKTNTLAMFRSAEKGLVVAELSPFTEFEYVGKYNKTRNVSSNLRYVEIWLHIIYNNLHGYILYELHEQEFQGDEFFPDDRTVVYRQASYQEKKTETTDREDSIATVTTFASYSSRLSVRVPKSVMNALDLQKNQSITLTVIAEYNNIKSPASSSLTFTYVPSNTIKYFDGTSWQDCIVYYFDGSTWNECIPYYFDGTAWNECSSS